MWSRALPLQMSPSFATYTRPPPLEAPRTPRLLRLRRLPPSYAPSLPRGLGWAAAAPRLQRRCWRRCCSWQRRVVCGESSVRGGAGRWPAVEAAATHCSNRRALPVPLPPRLRRLLSLVVHRVDGGAAGALLHVLQPERDGHVHVGHVGCAGVVWCQPVGEARCCSSRGTLQQPQPSARGCRRGASAAAASASSEAACVRGFPALAPTHHPAYALAPCPFAQRRTASSKFPTTAAPPTLLRSQRQPTGRFTPQARCDRCCCCWSCGQPAGVVGRGAATTQLC